MAPWTKTSVDVAGAGGEGARAGCTEVVAGADDLAVHKHCSRSLSSGHSRKCISS